MASDGTADATRTLDAREIDGEPFGDIMAALSELADEETLLLIAPFEPVPLYNVLENQGMRHDTTEVGDDEFHVEISHA
jgi:uncharacterized protein (DUF2249 family)